MMSQQISGSAGEAAQLSVCSVIHNDHVLLVASVFRKAQVERMENVCNSNTDG